MTILVNPRRRGLSKTERFPGTEEFVDCRIFSFKTGTVPGKLGKADHTTRSYPAGRECTFMSRNPEEKKEERLFAVFYQEGHTFDLGNEVFF